MSADSLKFKGHSNSVYCVALSPDGQYVATGSCDKTVIIFNALTGDVVRTLVGHGGYVHCVAFLPDGISLATGSGDKTARVWKIRVAGGEGGAVSEEEDDNRREQQQQQEEAPPPQAPAQGVLLFEGHQAAVYSIAVSSDGRYLLTGSDDKTAKLWDLRTWREVRTFEGHAYGILAVALSSDDRLVATGSEDTTARLWDARTGAEIRTFGGHAKSVTSVALSSEGRHLLTGSSDYTAKVWDLQNGAELRTFRGHSDAVFSVGLSSDSRLAATGSRDRTAKVWDFRTGEEIETFKFHKDYVRSVAVSPDAHFLLTAGSGDKTAKMTDLFALGIGRTPFFLLIEEAIQDEKKWPPYLILHELAERVTDVQELKLLYSSASATFKAGEITLSMRNRFISRAFEKAAEEFCFDQEKHVFSALVMALKKARADGAIDKKEYVRLEQLYVSADIFADFRFQSLVEVVQRNTARLDAVEARLDAIEEYIRRVDEDLQDFKACYRRTMQVRAATGIVSAIAGIFTFGIASGIVNAVGDGHSAFFDKVIDFSDMRHILEEVGSADETGSTNNGPEACEQVTGQYPWMAEETKAFGQAALKVAMISRKSWSDILKDEYIKENMDLLPVIAIIKLSECLSGPGMPNPCPGSSVKSNLTSGEKEDAKIIRERKSMLQEDTVQQADLYEVSDVLEELCLGHHLQLFSDNNIESVDDMKGISEHSLIEMGVQKVGERNRIMNWVREDEKYHLLFAHIDKDSNGRISMEEYTAALKTLGVVFDDNALPSAQFVTAGAKRGVPTIGSTAPITSDEFAQILRRAKVGETSLSCLRGVAEHPETALERLKAEHEAHRASLSFSHYESVPGLSGF